MEQALRDEVRTFGGRLFADTVDAQAQLTASGPSTRRRPVQAMAAQNAAIGRERQVLAPGAHSPWPASVDDEAAGQRA
jgi:hypothetical protein